jgi:hypothetical protein
MRRRTVRWLFRHCVKGVGCAAAERMLTQAPASIVDGKPFCARGRLLGLANSIAVVLGGGLTEIAVGSIIPDLCGYLVARGDAEHHASERETKQREIRTMPSAGTREVEKGS